MNKIISFLHTKGNMSPKKKSEKKVRHFIMLFIILLSHYACAQDSSFSKQQVQQDILKLENCDGEHCYKLEIKLMKTYIYNDSLFLSCMASNQKAFDQWLHSFVRIFTIYNGEDVIEEKLYFAYYSKLKELALSAAQKEYYNPAYKLMQQKIAKRLLETEIRFID